MIRFLLRKYHKRDGTHIITTHIKYQTIHQTLGVNNYFSLITCETLYYIKS